MIGVCSAGFRTQVQPGGQRRRQLPRRHQQRIIPRDDLAGDADRLLERQAHGVVGNRIHVSQNLCGQAAVVLEAGGDVGDIVFGFDDRLAGVAGFQFGQHGRVLANLLGEPEEHAAAFLRRWWLPTDRLRRRLWRRRRRGSRRRRWRPEPARSLLRWRDRRPETSCSTCCRPTRR